jgi:hypothetical protein
LNVAALLIFGSVAERVFGSSRYLFLVLLAIGAGNITSTWWNPNANTGGMSAAIIAVLGSLFSAGTVSPNTFIRISARPLVTPVLTVAAILIADGLNNERVDNASHISGLVVGLVLGPIFHTKVGRPNSSFRLEPIVISLWSLGIIAGAAAMQRSTRLSGDSMFLQTTHWMDRNEPGAVSQWEKVVRAARAGTNSDLELAVQLEKHVLPFWTEARQRLSRIGVAPGSPSAMQHEYLSTIANRREAAIKLCIDGLRTRNVDKVTGCNSDMAAIDLFIHESDRQ